MIVIVIIVTLAAIYAVTEFRDVKKITTTRNQTILYTNTELFFLDETWSRMNRSSLNGGLLTASGAILGISFVVSQIVISTIAEKYTPIALHLYSRRPQTTKAFFSLILVIAAATILLLVDEFLPLWVSFFLTLAVTNGFIVALLLFIEHFYDMFRMLNPNTFIQEIIRVPDNWVERIQLKLHI